ncbi:sugar kinase [Spongiactinospora gelatinilytica]|uniref:Sugar kinase n=1 Tax=Spongiactinospora gelatinilytica TaxID=2666298 RepID=A0A2W2HY41_9ACTN|nr:sugar kinase [Spongiactinospora gelatinilytica]
MGIDVGTASSKAVLVAEDGTVVASATRPHETANPRPGYFEHDPEGVWWADTVALLRDLRERAGLSAVAGVCASGIGPVALLTDAAGRPLRPAILYGIDTRAGREIGELTARLGAERVAEAAGNPLTSQAVGPKLMWARRHEPETWARARRWYQASSWLVHRLTGEYVMDRYSASASDPMYALDAHDWWDPAWEALRSEGAPGLERPRLAAPGEVVGEVAPAAADTLGLPAGVPVLAGTIDALAEAYSVGVRDVGDMMVMYGSTMFFIQHAAAPARHPGLWNNASLTGRGFSVAAGMATSGLVTGWLRDLTGVGYAELAAEAERVAPGSDGLVLLPYFAGERTPVADPGARGVWAGLTLRHTRAHLYRSILEGVAFGVRHNIEAMAEAGADPARLVAVGGGATALWPRIVTDVTGRPQDLPSTTVGASYGDARLVADALGVDTSTWNPVKERLEPDPVPRDRYDELYGVYRRTYQALRTDLHLLAEIQTGGRPAERSADLTADPVDSVARINRDDRESG